MPILDYEQNAKTAYDAVLNDDKVTPINKEAVKRFALAYHVKPATKAKFYRHLILFLRESQDINKEMFNRDIINKLFAQLKRDISPGYYGTMINCVNRFVKWLNDDMKPSGFKDIKSPSKKSQKRKLEKRDMWEWEDGLEAIKHTSSVQLKAALMLQLNLGARPSEFIDLEIRDIEVKDPFVIVHIRDGKTGPREVVLYYAAPYIQQWLANHPDKANPRAPLWVIENARKSHRNRAYANAPSDNIRKIQYNSLRARIRDLAAKAGIDKPTDHYTLRHSCARLLRLWGVPIEECAKHMGHSVKEFEETYGRLDTRDRELRHAKAYGIASNGEEETTPDNPVMCKRCEYINAPGTANCLRCTSALTIAAAMEKEDALTKRLEKIEQIIGQLASEVDAKARNE